MPMQCFFEEPAFTGQELVITMLLKYLCVSLSLCAYIQLDLSRHELLVDGLQNNLAQFSFIMIRSTI